MKTIRFTIKGRGNFPDDMLRYACAWPASSFDAGQMVGGYDRRHVTLETDRGWPSKMWPLGDNVVDRFASFGWHVVCADGLLPYKVQGCRFWAEDVPACADAA